MLLSTANVAGSGLITGTLVYFMQTGWKTPIYFDVADYGWTWTIVGTLVLFVLSDAAAYYAHRFFHVRFMYKHFHKVHHRYPSPSPWVVTAVHPVEMLILQAATFLPLFVIPFHFVSAIVVFVYFLIFNIVDHSGVDLESRLPWQGPSRYHDDHHVYFHVNFGQHLMIWDRLHGTLRRTKRKYGVEVFGGKGAPASNSDTDGGDFVRY